MDYNFMRYVVGDFQNKIQFFGDFSANAWPILMKYQVK